MGIFRNLKIEHVFVIFVMFFGLLMLMFTPPFQSVDEQNHFFRAYEISVGDFVPHKYNNDTGAWLPTSLAKLYERFDYLIKNINAKTSFIEIQTAYNINLDSTEKSFISFNNTAMYSPVAYIPQSLAIFIARIMNLPPLAMFYLGRFFNIIVYTIFGYLTIRTTPVLKQVVFLILLMPMNLSLAASLSSDVLLIGVSLLYFAYILKIIFSDKGLKCKDFIILSSFILIFAMIKYNFILFLLLFMISKRLWGDKYVLKFLGILMLPVLLCVLWTNLVSSLCVETGGNADISEQICFIKNNILQYIFILINTFIIKMGRILITMIGVLGWQDVRLDFTTYIIYPFLLLCCCASRERSYVLSRFQISIIAILLVISFILISTCLYCLWNPVGSNIVLGLNGKYFVTLLFPFLFMVSSIWKKRLPSIPSKILYLSVFVVLASALLSIVFRFYHVLPNLYYAV